LTFTPVSGTAGVWTVQGTVPGASKSLWNTPATVQFNTSTGQLASITNNDTGVTVTPNLNGSYSLPVTNMPSNYTFPTGDTWNIDFPASGSGSALTQFAGENTAAAVSQDGNAGGTLQSFSIGSSGVITGSFSNGQTLALGQIALASFANPGGLTSIGSLNYAASPNSGQPLLGPPGSGGRGTLIGGSLETSNVNLARQLTDLIIAQEAYQANTKVFATSSQVIQALVSMP
jgi:flagellar hook protein FlgE